MNKTTQFSKILQIEKDLRFRKKSKTPARRHYDNGQSINLQFDEGLNVFARQYSDESFVPVVEPDPEGSMQFTSEDVYTGNSRQFAGDDYYVDSFSHTVEDNGYGMAAEKYTTQKEDEEEDSYRVTTVSSGRNEDGTRYVHRNTESYEDEIAYSERPGGDYSAESAFNEDIKAILAGQKVYNQDQKQLVASKAQGAEDGSSSDNYSGQSSSITDSNANGLREQDVSNPHAIFDSMAKSFGNAKSYDLGTLNLDKSFAEIEATIAKREESQENKKKADELNALIGDQEIVQVVEEKKEPVIDPLSPQLALDNLDIVEDLSIITEDSGNKVKEVNPAISPVKTSICETDEYNQSFSVSNFSTGLATDPGLLPLLSYLDIPYSRFQPIEGAYFRRLKELLLFHNMVTASDVVDSSNYVVKVKEFQKKVMKDSNPDGIPGENTLFELQRGWAPTRGISLVKSGVRNDAYDGAPIAFRLRSDVLPLYNKLYDEVHQQGGIVTSAGSFRDLSASVTAGRSSTSMHYTGLALDLHTGSGMQNTTSNVYLVERSGTNRWQVWNKVQDPYGDLKNINAQIYNSQTKTIAPVAVNTRVIDFKKIANSNGFSDIGNRQCFPEDYMCAEWWHFQCEEVLVPYISQFGTELLTIYRQSELEAHPNIWQSRKKIFKKDWF